MGGQPWQEATAWEAVVLGIGGPDFYQKAIVEADQQNEAMDYLLKPSPLIVAGLTLGIAIAKATAVAKTRILR